MELAHKKRSMPVGRLVAVTGLVVALMYAAADRLIEDVLEIASTWGQIGEVGTAAWFGDT